MSCATLGFSAMMSRLAHLFRRLARATLRAMPTICHLARTHACTRARAHRFNVPNEEDRASPPCPNPCCHRGARAGGGASRSGAAACTARACSRCKPIAAGETHHRVHRRGHHLARGAAPPPARPEPDPNHTFYFHIDDQHVIDANVGGNASRWINHACDPNCEADETDGRVFIKALRDRCPAKSCSTTTACDRRALHAQAEEASTSAAAALTPAAARGAHRPFGRH
jgi:hypothetical protein